MKIRTRAELRRLGLMGWAVRGCFTGAEAAPVAAEAAGSKAAADAVAPALVGGAEGAIGAAGGAELAGLTAADIAAGGTAALGAGALSEGAGGLVGGAEGGGAAGGAEGAVGGATGTDAAGVATELGGAGAAAAAGGEAGVTAAGGAGSGLADAGAAAAGLPGAEAPALSAGPQQGAAFASEAPAPAFSSVGPEGSPVGGGFAGDATGAAAAGGELSGEEELLAKIRAANAATAAGSGATQTPTIAASLLEKLKNNPLTAAALGVNVASQIANRNSAKQIPAQLKAVAAPASEASKTLLDQYKAGTINPSTQFDIDKWKQQQIASTKNYYSRAGIPNSSAARNAIAAIEAKAVAMQDQARQGLLTQGLTASGVAAGPLTSAIEAEAAQDKQFAASQGSALQSLMLLQAMEAGRTPANAGV